MSAETEILREFFDAINRCDVPAIVKDFDPQIVRVEPPGFPTLGTYRGIDEVRELVKKGRGSWAEGSCDPEGSFRTATRSSSISMLGSA